MFLAKKVLGSKEVLNLGNIYAKRDWGHAKDYVEMQWKILQQKKPEDFVIATGKAYTVKQFVNMC
jgi:GDPmannose 4,6-dehydratase